jgi:CRP-like cAMP-binding protein
LPSCGLSRMHGPSASQSLPRLGCLLLIPFIAGAIRRVARSMPWSLPHRRGDGCGHVQSQHIYTLRQLSADKLKSVQPWLRPVQLQSNTVLHKPGKTIEQVYFPLSGLISLLAVMRSGEQIEIGIVGADGLVGGGAAIDGQFVGQLTVQLDDAAERMSKAQFIEAYLRHPRLRNLVDRYQAILLMQAQQNAACRARAGSPRLPTRASAIQLRRSRSPNQDKSLRLALGQVRTRSQVGIHTATA